MEIDHLSLGTSVAVLDPVEESEKITKALDTKCNPMEVDNNRIGPGT